MLWLAAFLGRPRFFLGPSVALALGFERFFLGAFSLGALLRLRLELGFDVGADTPEDADGMGDVDIPSADAMDVPES